MCRATKKVNAEKNIYEKNKREQKLCHESEVLRVKYPTCAGVIG